MSKIIFINRFFYPDLSATSQLLTDLALELVKDGQNVHIVTRRRLYNDRSTILPKRDTYKGVEVHRITTSSYSRFGLPGRALDFIIFYLAATIKLLILTKSGDILVAKTDPPLMSILVRLVGSLKQAKTINWLQDIFPEIAEQLGMLPRGYGIGTLLRSLRNWSLRYSDANVVLGERMRQKLLSFGVSDEKVQIIPNWVDEKLIHPISHEVNPLRKQWNLEGKFVVLYSGNMGRAHEFDMVIEAAKQLKDAPNIVFLWIGGGVKKKEVEQAALKNDLTNFIFKDYQEKEQLKQSFGVGDVHLVILSEKMEGLIVPSKLYGATAAGRPVMFVGDKDGEVAVEIKKAECGYSFLKSDSNKFAKYLVHLSLHPKEVERMGSNSRELFQSSYGVSISTGKWKKLISSVQSTRRAIFLPR